MKYEELLDIVKTGEGYTLEFKESFSSAIGKEICALANSIGGKIIIGVEDKTNRIKGYKLNNSDSSKIQDIARNMSPPFNVQVEQIKNLVIIYIPEGKDKPYTINGHFYLRYGANSQQLNRDEIRNQFQKENLISFEKQITEYENSDFSVQVFNRFRKEANLDKNLSTEHILLNLNLKANDKLNNAGILFFTKNIKKYFQTAIISCFLYSDEEQIDIIDSKEFTGNFITNLEEAYKYLISKLNNAMILDGELKHRKKLELPREALRETIINAMIHKDYFINSNVQINISPDRVEVVNPGILLFPKSVLGKISVYRNPILADLMQRINEIEKAGSGIKRIKRYCKQDNIKVRFETGEFFRTIFYRGKGQIRHKSVTNPSQIRYNWILKYLKINKTIKNSIITKQFSINRDTAREDLYKLIKENIIIKKGGGSNVWYEINKNGIE